MKVLHLTYADPAGVAIFNADALMSVYPDIEVRVIRQNTNYIDYPADIETDNVDGWLDWADIVHYHQTGVSPEQIKNQGVNHKRVVYHFHHRHYNWYFNEWRNLAKDYYSVVSTPNLTLLNNDEWLPSPRPDYHHLHNPSGLFTVCQAPTNRKVKSTLQVIDACKQTNLPLDLIEKVTFKQSIERKAKCNLLIDQFSLGYGLNAVEAWSLGMPVIGYATDEILQRIEELLGFIPFFPSKLEDLSNNLKEIQKPETHKEWQDKGRLAYNKYHSYESVGKKTLEIYQKVLHKPSHYIPFQPQVEISVIIPCYNYSSYLPDAIQSLDRQTFTNWQAVIVNDCDPDFSIPDWIANHPQVTIINNKINLGIAGAINAGIKVSTGRYITVLSADDAMKHQRLETLYNAAIFNPHQFVYDDLTVFGPGTARIRGLDKDNNLLLPDYDFSTILNKNGIHAGSLYPLSAWVQSGGYPEVAREGREDHAYNVAMGIKGWCGVHLSEPLYLYRRHSANRTNFDSNQEWRQIYNKRMRDLYPELYNGRGKPMGCCGGSKNRSNQVQGVQLSQANLPGSKDGWTKVEYIGSSTSDQSWWVGGMRYYLGGNRKRGYVANEHLQDMLNKSENGRPLFKIVQETKPTQLTTELDPTAIISQEEDDFMSKYVSGFVSQETAQEEIVSQELVESIAPLPDLSNTIAVISEQLSNLNASQLEQLLEDEQAGKNRSTLISKIEAELNDRAITA